MLASTVDLFRTTVTVSLTKNADVTKEKTKMAVQSLDSLLYRGLLYLGVFLLNLVLNLCPQHGTGTKW